MSAAKLFIFALALASTQAFSLRVKDIKSPDVTTCMDGTDAWFSNIVLNITPWPAHIATGETITLDGAIDILQEVEMGSGLDLKLTLVTAIGNLPIPCLPIGELNIGSCSYDIQHLLEELKGAVGGEEICQGLMAEGQDCNLPFMPGQYAAGTDVIEILLPEIPAVLQPFLKGTINAQVTMRSVLSRPIASLRNSLRRGGEWHAPTPEQMRGAQNNWLYMHFFSERGWFPAESNTTYETELARISKELGWDAEHAHLPAADFTIEERRYWAWNDRFWTISIGFALGLFPFMTDYLGNQSEHSRREAILRIREAAAAGKSPINPDYVPNELIESMVPPAGDWEKIWLSRQPSTMSRGSAKWCW